MTTLGFGDITFESDAGRLFSVVVLLSGSAFLLVMLPFVFIQFVFIPWMDERDRRRAPRALPANTPRRALPPAWIAQRASGAQAPLQHARSARPDLSRRPQPALALCASMHGGLDDGKLELRLSRCI